MKVLSTVSFFVLFCVSVFATEIQVATLNTFLLFDPAIDHRGKVDEQNRMAPADYARKLENLVKLTEGFAFIGLQETGGRVEIEALAKQAGYEWGFAKGKDTYTGQEVGALIRMPGWKVAVNGRVGELDALLSKHLLVTAQKGTEKVRFLVVHLLRPMGANKDKHDRQLAGIAEWIKSIHQTEPGATIAVIGDFNNVTTLKGSTIIGPGQDAGSLIEYAPTHLAGKPFDRLILAGRGKWSDVKVVRPPYGPRPNDLNKSLWTDHFLLGATLHTEN